MSKKHKGVLCVYCGRRVAATADHVFAREFFLVQHRANLPQAPACAICNNEKSTLEHYLTALLPFGGRHRHARRMLAEMVPPRLAKNRKLHNSIRAGMTKGWSEHHGALVLTSGIPIDPNRLLRLIELVVRGLIWHHWQVRLSDRDTVTVYALGSGGVNHFNKIFSRNAAQRVRANLGEGTFAYEGVQGIDLPEITAWRLIGYGGMQFADPNHPGENCTMFGALTGPASTRPPADGEEPAVNG